MRKANWQLANWLLAGTLEQRFRDSNLASCQLAS
jgi:hypothetical protein